MEHLLCFLSQSCTNSTSCPCARASRERTEAVRVQDSPGILWELLLAWPVPVSLLIIFFSALVFNTVVLGRNMDRIEHQECSKFGE